MKGVSTILATILIVIIVVALISLTYTFAIGLVGTSTRGAERSVSDVTIRLDKRISFVNDPVCDHTNSNWIISFSIRHDGATYNISSNEIAAFFGNDPTTLSWPGGDMKPGEAKAITATNSTAINWGGETRSFAISAPAGSISRTVICPS